MINYWIFKCNPNKFLLRKRLQDSKARTSWQVDKQYKNKIMKGDTAFIWRAERDVGILAIMKVDSIPYEFEEFPHEIKFYRTKGKEKPDIGKRLRVKGIFLGRCRIVRSKEMKKNEILRPMSALRGIMGTNFALTKKQGKILMSFFEKRKDKMVYTAGN
jgi:predicted RNA-binding protein with PUA-like domain